MVQALTHKSLQAQDLYTSNSQKIKNKPAAAVGFCGFIIWNIIYTSNYIVAIEIKKMLTFKILY